ncbi:MAG: hypothetical protein V4732_03630 [Pseudomonadota bacterium]
MTFTLKDVPGNCTLLTVVKSDSNNVPLHRRLEVFRINSDSWEAQLENIAHHVSTWWPGFARYGPLERSARQYFRGAG